MNGRNFDKIIKFGSLEWEKGSWELKILTILLAFAVNPSYTLVTSDDLMTYILEVFIKAKGLSFSSE